MQMQRHHCTEDPYFLPHLLLRTLTRQCDLPCDNSGSVLLVHPGTSLAVLGLCWMLSLTPASISGRSSEVTRTNESHICISILDNITDFSKRPLLERPSLIKYYCRFKSTASEKQSACQR